MEKFWNIKKKQRVTNPDLPKNDTLFLVFSLVTNFLVSWIRRMKIWLVLFEEKNVENARQAIFRNILNHSRAYLFSSELTQDSKYQG